MYNITYRQRGRERKVTEKNLQNNCGSFHVNLTNCPLGTSSNLMKFSSFVYIIEK